MTASYSYPDWVTGQIAVGHAPLSMGHLKALKDQGITCIMNLCAEFCELHSIEREEGFEVYYMPVEDEEAPELRELELALEWLDESVFLGKKVLIHCRHGIGRTGTVLNAYLLRRGLGHRLAAQALAKLKSKPANFQQWWAIRKYGKKSARLTVREPSLEFKRAVDLSPFFAEFEALVGQAERAVSPGKGRCGNGHTDCCRTPVSLTLIEAVHLANGINRDLTSSERMQAIDRAVAVARQERRAAAEAETAGDSCISATSFTCPLLVADKCRAFPFRPLQCRTSDLPPQEQERLWNETLTPALTQLSGHVWLAFTGKLPPESLPFFALPDVVSGRYVQAFFHLLMSLGI